MSPPGDDPTNVHAIASDVHQGQGWNGQPRVHISAPEPPPRPEEARRGAIWVRVEELTVQTFTLALLRTVGRAMSPKELALSMVTTDPHRSGLNVGTIANVGTRLGETVIKREEGRWVLFDREKAPILHEGYAWGDPDLFQATEQAWYRRTLVRHVLKAMPSGLLPKQILDLLEEAPWRGVPVNADLIKLDLKALADKDEIVRVMGSSKWKAAP
jgi:hypothetical protein